MEIDWARDFDTNTDFFHRVTSTSPQELASSLTVDDTAEFFLLDPHTIICEGSHLQHLHRRWDQLCEAIQEIITADSWLCPVLAAFAEVSLLSLLHSDHAKLCQELYLRRNFYSLCAVLQALREIGFDESKLPHLFVLIDTGQNYANYRKAYEVAPSLPFLPPHIRHLRYNATQGLSEIYSFVLYKDMKLSRQVHRLEKRELVFARKRLSRTDWAWVKKKLRIPWLAARNGSETTNGQQES